MATPATVFSLPVAALLVDRRVRLVKPMGGLPAGLTGTVIGAQEYRSGYVLEVKWEGMHPATTVDFEYFTKDDWDEFLTEC